MQQPLNISLAAGFCLLCPHVAHNLVQHPFHLAHAVLEVHHLSLHDLDLGWVLVDQDMVPLADLALWLGISILVLFLVKLTCPFGGLSFPDASDFLLSG